MKNINYGVYIHPEELDSFWVQRAEKAGISLVALHPVGGEQAAASFASFLKTAKQPAFQSHVAALRKAGIGVETAAHVLSFLLPRALFSDHPDWFRMNEQGERTADCNLCPSSEEAMAFLSDRAEELVGQIPADGHRYHLWPDDVTSGACCCEACRQLSAADQALMITNAILRGLRRKDKEAKLSFLAYHATMELPETVQPKPGVFLEFAPMDRLYDRPLADASCEKNRQQIAPLPALLDRFGRKDATALDYWFDNSLQSGWKKPPVKCVVQQGVLASDRMFYAEMGFPYVTAFACYLGADYVALHGSPPDFRLLTGK